MHGARLAHGDQLHVRSTLLATAPCLTHKHAQSKPAYVSYLTPNCVTLPPCAVGVLLLNKYLLSNTGFYYPIFLTMCHMMACATIGGGAALLRLPGLPPFKALQSRVQGFKVGYMHVALGYRY